MLLMKFLWLGQLQSHTLYYASIVYITLSQPSSCSFQHSLYKDCNIILSKYEYIHGGLQKLPYLYTPWTLKIDWYFVESFDLAKRQTRENVGVKERSNGKGSDGDFDIEWLGLMCERNWQGFFSSVDLFERISLLPPSPQQQQCEILWIVGTLWLCPHPADALAAKRLKGFSTDLPPPDQKYSFASPSICSNTAQGLFQIWWEVRSQGVAFSQINIGRRNEDGFDRNLLEVFAFAFSAGILHLPAPWQNICWRQTKDFLHIQTKDFSQVQTKDGSHVSADDC